jgi:hypothetical protein
MENGSLDITSLKLEQMTNYIVVFLYFQTYVNFLRPKSRFNQRTIKNYIETRLICHNIIDIE